MEKLELENLREQIVSLLNQIKSKDEYIAQLETIPLIAKYNAFLYDREKLQEEYEEMQKENEIVFKENCPHPLWYLRPSDPMYFGLRNIDIYNGICVRCKDIQMKYSVFMGNSIFRYNDKGEMVQSNVPYEVINQEFLELEREGYSFDEIKEILYSKYTSQDVDLARNLKMKYMPKQGE